MGEDAKLFIGQGVKIMVGDNPVGIAKEGMLTYQVEDDGATKDSGAWENPMRHAYEITGKAVATNVGDPIKTRSGETMFYDGFIFDSFRSIVCLCHPAKKDGTASKAIRHMIWSDF